jgi:hypothetical protein
VRRSGWRSVNACGRALAWFALAQAGFAAEPNEILHQALAKLQATLQNFPKYMCIETVERQYFGPAAKQELVDRLRLEVTVAGGREIYSWPGATRFDSRDVADIIRQGPIATGSFATHLLAVFDSPGVEFRFLTQQSSGGQTLLNYRFHIPREASRYHVRAGAAWQPVGYDGTFWLDADSLELQRLTFQSDERPPGTSITALDGDLQYRRVSTAGFDILLPRESQLRIAFASARQTNNITTFSDCRVYQAESALVFEGDAPVDQRPARVLRVPMGLPVGLPVTLALTAPIDSQFAAAGDQVSARVVHAVHKPGSGEVLIPEGTTVLGRLTRVEHHLLPTAYFLVAISFNRLQFEGGLAPFAAHAEQNESLARELGVSPAGQGGGFGFWDVGTFLFPSSRSRLVIPAGFASKWMTLSTRFR